MAESKYIIVAEFLRELIQKEEIKVGEYLPSENELCSRFSVTRTTVRRAMDQLMKEGFIEKLQGRGSRVRERRKSLGLLTVKGFSEAVGSNVQTEMLQKPVLIKSNPPLTWMNGDSKDYDECIYFERLRKVNDIPVMIEKNWLPGSTLAELLDTDFVDGSFFRTLSRNFKIEITGSDHILKAESASSKIAALLQMPVGSPVLHISVKFSTNKTDIIILSELYCNTSQYPVGNNYSLNH